MTSTAATLITISIALLAGLLLSRLAKKIHLSAVTAYLIAGVIIGFRSYSFFGFRSTYGFIILSM